jgi:Arc/MetJ-type ribon-helix-helix transcriptional regulator
MPHRSYSFSLPLHVIDDLRRLAEAREESMSFVIREALRAYFREHLGDRSQPAPTTDRTLDQLR